MRWSILVFAAALFNNANGQNQVWPLNSAVTDLAVGPDTAVHCQLTSPSGAVTFDGFGPCRVNIDHVTMQHSGVWTLNAIQPSNVVAVRQTFTVQVTSAVATSKPTVLTSVQTVKPLVNLTCSIVSTEAITNCLFRDPSGQLLQASQGVSEGRYSFIESTTAGAEQSCGIQINGPETADLGLWRCDLETASDTNFGHLSVLCPWSMQVPEIAEKVVSVPTLTSQTNDQVVSEGDSVTVSCSIQSAIRYCYFRSRNGSVFNVRPGMTASSMEYVGAGLEAGECGVRFSSMAASDSGTWSCHVGLPSSNEPEQLVRFSIQVQEPFSANQYVEGNELVVEGTVNGQSALEYCRFVRMDGYGFTSENVPAGYTDGSSPSQGLCKLRVTAPTILDHHPWTVVAKILGQDDELAQSTDHTIEFPPSPPGGPVTWWLWLVLAAVVLAAVVAFAFKRNRHWAAETASGFRNSFRKEPVLDEKPPLPAEARPQCLQTDEHFNPAFLHLHAFPQPFLQLQEIIHKRCFGAASLAIILGMRPCGVDIHPHERGFSVTPNYACTNFGGAIIQQRVASNSSAAIQRFPFTAAILHGPNGIFDQVCGGSILTTTAVLTVASCLDTQGRPNPASQYRVRVGSAQPNAGGSIASVLQITRHPFYNYRTLNADIALLRVSTLTYSAAVQPIVIAGANYNVTDNDAVFVIGWGQNQSVAIGLRDTLRYVQQNVVSQSYCRALLGYEGLNVTDGMVCTGRALGEFCGGDYGGPVVCAADGVLVGVASYSYRCGEKRYPSLSTRVSYYANWIVNTAR